MARQSDRLSASGLPMTRPRARSSPASESIAGRPDRPVGYATAGPTGDIGAPSRGRRAQTASASMARWRSRSPVAQSRGLTDGSASATLARSSPPVLVDTMLAKKIDREPERDRRLHHRPARRTRSRRNVRRRFFSLDFGLPPDRRLPFATIITGDRYDGASDLDRLGVYRLNLGVGRGTFRALAGAVPTRLHTDAEGATAHVDAALDRVVSHPVCGAMFRVCILNPSVETFQRTVAPLLAEADEVSSRRQGRSDPAKAPWSRNRERTGSTSGFACGVTPARCAARRVHMAPVGSTADRRAWSISCTIQRAGGLVHGPRMGRRRA